MHINPPLPTRTRISATRLRAEMTDAERKLWFHLRAGRLCGLKFRRQHPTPPYVVDFYCHDALLAVELDGSQHGLESDAARTAALERQGIRVLRFWDNQVFTEFELVLEQIMRVAKIRTLSRRCAPPSPEGRGEELEPLSPRERGRGEGTVLPKGFSHTEPSHGAARQPFPKGEGKSKGKQERARTSKSKSTHK